MLYDIKVSAVNAIGDESELSNSVTIAMAERASQPPVPTINREKSSLTSVYIEWQEGVAGQIQVLGFKLYMIDLQDGSVTNVYSGVENADVREYSVNGL
jgi:predicted phage tail protein